MKNIEDERMDKTSKNYYLGYRGYTEMYWQL